ncbi:DUF4258 domain-containing protein [Hoeflea sp. YIM 152468]|uniref:DUF4258 domain-containing protein n=1 Tax=Hoeflea sp. YIM 152468 TaxID=3031759 RepID=UPI0023DA196B|nr:DUF4258 domain-containing protein [Hoeflea sp. YIM 152468]MDF1609985.1 DUF4258 domain-containing protein [Hoeflea sp. YIM 152468]
MSETFTIVVSLIEQERFEVSLHALQELLNDGILIEPLIGAVGDGIVVEDYPDYHKGPAVLLLQRDEFGHPIHLVWGIPRDAREPAVLVTAYRPDPTKWDKSFTLRERS